jgi:hypothetical protein
MYETVVPFILTKPVPLRVVPPPPPETAVVDMAVILPNASTVITGTSEPDPYDPAVTPELARVSVTSPVPESAPVELDINNPAPTKTLVISALPEVVTLMSDLVTLSSNICLPRTPVTGILKFIYIIYDR